MRGLSSSLPLQVCLAGAFIVEGLLFSFHLEGSDLNRLAHLLLLITAYLCAAAVLAELRHPSCAFLGVARAQALALQGLWFVQICKMFFEGATLRSISHKQHASAAGHTHTDGVMYHLHGPHAGKEAKEADCLPGCRQPSLGPTLPRQPDDGAGGVLRMPHGSHGGHRRAVCRAAAVLRGQALLVDGTEGSIH